MPNMQFPDNVPDPFEHIVIAHQNKWAAYQPDFIGSDISNQGMRLPTKTACPTFFHSD